MYIYILYVGHKYIFVNYNIYFFTGQYKNIQRSGLA